MRSGFGFDHMVIRRHVLAVLALDTACLQARAAAKTRNDRSAKENDRGEEGLKPHRAKSVPEALRAVKPGGAVDNCDSPSKGSSALFLAVLGESRVAPLEGGEDRQLKLRFRQCLIT
jgi:hypothetical protein